MPGCSNPKGTDTVLVAVLDCVLIGAAGGEVSTAGATTDLPRRVGVGVLVSDVAILLLATSGDLFRGLKSGFLKFWFSQPVVRRVHGCSNPEETDAVMDCASEGAAGGEAAGGTVGGGGIGGTVAGGTVRGGGIGGAAAGGEAVGGTVQGGSIGGAAAGGKAAVAGGTVRGGVIGRAAAGNDGFLVVFEGRGKQRRQRPIITYSLLIGVRNASLTVNVAMPQVGH